MKWNIWPCTVPWVHTGWWLLRYDWSHPEIPLVYSANIWNFCTVRWLLFKAWGHLPCCFGPRSSLIGTCCCVICIFLWIWSWKIIPNLFCFLYLLPPENALASHTLSNKYPPYRNWESLKNPRLTSPHAHLLGDYEFLLFLTILGWLT